jgi:hypothetical protein
MVRYQFTTTLPSTLMNKIANVHSVIFSVWTSTLDVMYEALQRAGVSCCRFQGSMRYAKRTEYLRQFDEVPSIKVILISITCGGQGYDNSQSLVIFLIGGGLISLCLSSN